MGVLQNGLKTARLQKKHLLFQEIQLGTQEHFSHDKFGYKTNAVAQNDKCSCTVACAHMVLATVY